MTEGQPPPQPNLNILIDPAHMGGVYANYARVSHSPFEFTVDFVRMDWPSQQGVVVARVALSPLMVDQLITALSRNWSLYAEKAMPPEVQDAQKSVEDLGDTGHEPPPTGV